MEQSWATSLPISSSHLGLQGQGLKMTLPWARGGKRGTGQGPGVGPLPRFGRVPSEVVCQQQDQDCDQGKYKEEYGGDPESLLLGTSMDWSFNWNDVG